MNNPAPEYKWVSVNSMLGVTLRWTTIPFRGSRNTPSGLCYRNRDKLRPDEPLGSYADFFPYLQVTWWALGKWKGRKNDQMIKELWLNNDFSRALYKAWYISQTSYTRQRLREMTRFWVGWEREKHACQVSEGEGKGKKRARKAREDRERSQALALLLTLSVPFYGLLRRLEQELRRIIFRYSFWNWLNVQVVWIGRRAKQT